MLKAKTATERKQAERQRNRDKGHVALEVWTFAHLKEQVRKYVATINAKVKK